MKLLLDGKLEPITSEFGFVQAPPDIVAGWWLQREATIQRERGGGVDSRSVSGDLVETLSCLLPLTSVERRRVLLVATSSEWTAVFDNGWQGGDAAGLSSTALDLRCQAMRVVAVSDIKVQGTFRRYGARIFELYGAERTEFLNYVRTISVANDGGRWRMDQSGEPLPGEDPSWFSARQVKDRFREEHLALLLRSFGIEAFDQAFYRRDALLIERHGPTAPGYREYQLAEIQSQWVSSSPNN